MNRTARRATFWQPNVKEMATAFAKPAHDEEAYYNPPGRRNRWEGMRYFWLMSAAGVSGWLAWGWWAGLIAT